MTGGAPLPIIRRLKKGKELVHISTQLEEAGSLIEAKVTRISQAGAQFMLYNGRRGFVHISEIAGEQVRQIRDYLAIGEVKTLKALKINDRGEVECSLKQVGEGGAADEKYKYPADGDPKPISPPPGGHGHDGHLSFDDKVKRFLRQSEDRLLDLKRSTENKRSGGKKKKTTKRT